MSGSPAWLASAHPPVPPTFRERLAPWLAGVEPGVPFSLEAAGVRALRRALEPAAAERGGAFDLLAADALLTWAAEAALDAADPDVPLQGMLKRIAEEGEAG